MSGNPAPQSDAQEADVPETPSEGPFSQDFPQMFQEIMDNLKEFMPSKKAESFDAQYEIGPTSIYDLHEKFTPYGEAELQFGNYGTKVMMTPKEFLSLCDKPARENRQQYKLEKYRKSFEQGIPISQICSIRFRDFSLRMR